MSKQKVDIVIVTYNRLAKLKHTLDCYDKQTVPFRTMIVVDNNSTDGTKEYLKEWETQKAAYEKHVIYLEKNAGGSGGFYEGEKYAMDNDPDWVYVADDDAYPDPDMMEKFYAFQAQHEDEKIAIICSAVQFMDRSPMCGCRGFIRIENNQFIKRDSVDSDYDQDYFELNSVSYVGAFISAKALKEVGLVKAEFFLYQDDTEHSVRLAKYGKMYCVPGMVVLHDSVPIAQMSVQSINAILWKEYYAERNIMYMLLHHYPAIGKATLKRNLLNIGSHRRATLSPVDKMKLEGYYDAIRGKLGIHEVYRPGLEVTKENNLTLPYPKALWEMMYWVLRVYKTFAKKK